VDIVAGIVLGLRQLVQRSGFVHRSECDDRHALPNGQLLVARRARELGQPSMRGRVEWVDEHRAVERFGRALRVAELHEHFRQSIERLAVDLGQRRQLRQRIRLATIVVLLGICRREKRVGTIVAAVFREQRAGVFQNCDALIELVVLQHRLAGDQLHPEVVRRALRRLLGLGD
jgi:hypothetical protein